MSEKARGNAAVGHDPNRRTRHLVTALQTLLGIVLVLTPLALWVAWSEAVLLLVLACNIAAITALVLCHWLINRGQVRSGRKQGDRRGPGALSDEFVAAVSNVAPWTYHNRITGDGDFKRNMARLRKMLKSS